MRACANWNANDVRPPHLATAMRMMDELKKCRDREMIDDVFCVLYVLLVSGLRQSKREKASIFINCSHTIIGIPITKTPTMQRTLRFSVFATVILTQSLVDCLSSQGKPDIEPRQFIQLINPINTRVGQSIPVSFVRDWPTWVLDQDGTFSRIPDDDGFVQPTSVDEVWQPIDLKRPGLKLALGLHM